MTELEEEIKVLHAKIDFLVGLLMASTFKDYKSGFEKYMDEFNR